MNRYEFAKAIKNLPAAEQTRARELAQGLRQQGCDAARSYERALAYVLEG